MIGEHVIAEVHLGTSQTSMMKITLHKKLITLHKKLVTLLKKSLMENFIFCAVLATEIR